MSLEFLRNPDIKKLSPDTQTAALAAYAEFIPEMRLLKYVLEKSVAFESDTMRFQIPVRKAAKDCGITHKRARVCMKHFVERDWLLPVKSPETGVVFSYIVNLPINIPWATVKP